MDIIDRREYIRKILEDKVSVVGADDIYRNDPQYHAEIYRLIETLTLVDQAMEDEGVFPEVRAKILDTVFIGISKHELAAARLIKAEKALIKLVSGWDK